MNNIAKECATCKHVGIKDFIQGYCKNNESGKNSVKPSDWCDEWEYEEDKIIQEYMKQAINMMDELLVKFAFQAKLGGHDNQWIYQQLRSQIEEQDERLRPYLIQWLDARWGEH